MPLRSEAVDRLFQRLAATYGAAWDRQMGSAPIADVKGAWAHELANFDGHMDMLAWALEHLPERAPNVIEFRNLARRAPAPAEKQLTAPAADPLRVAAEIAKLDLHRDRPDPKDWARRILKRHEEGAKLNPYTLRCAQEALA